MGDHAELWQWRRLVAGLYAAVRAADEPEGAWHHWRRTRDELFRHHAQSPLEPAARAGFAGLRYFDYDPELRFEVALDEPPDAEPLAAQGEGAMSLVPFARSRGLEAALGAELTFYWIAGYGGGVFLPFTDATSGGATFGGGRYLLDTIKGADLGPSADGRAVLDFNFAYNPSCAYSGRWLCPLAPAANRLPGPVTAGEKLPA